MKLIERDILRAIRKNLKAPDTIVIHGARQVGKTSVLKMLESEISKAGIPVCYIDLEDRRMLELMDRGPNDLIVYLEQTGRLKNDRLVLLIDEIQYLKDPSNLIKILRDHHSERIKLIVSGSSSFDIKRKFSDSLVGRTINFELYSLNFREFLKFKNIDIDLEHPVTSMPLINQLKKLFSEFVLYGGYPRVILETEIEAKESYLSQILSTYVRKDIRDLANIRDIDKFNKLLEVLASQCGQMVNVAELAGTTHLSRPTIEQYLFLLESTYVIRLIKPFSRNIRSELFKTPKVFFLDTGLAQLLWLKSFQKTVQGNVLENAVFCELIKQQKKTEIRYWRTQDGKEIDFIIKSGTNILPIEVKLSGSRFNATAIRYFSQHYHPSSSICMTLDNNMKPIDNLIFKYPWEVPSCE